MLITPLHVAVESGNIRTVTELLVLGARLDIADAQGNSVFHLAANSTVEMIQVLSETIRFSWYNISLLEFQIQDLLFWAFLARKTSNFQVIAYDFVKWSVVSVRQSVRLF